MDLGRELPVAVGVTDPELDGQPLEAPGDATGTFAVHLDNFEGPFDLLLQLIAKHQLDVTEVALAKVTDDFIAHLRADGSAWNLDQTSEFLLVAATLLDLKAARLLPTAEVEDEEDLALLEARDLLFARLLQYRAYKEAAAYLATLLDEEARRYPRSVSLEPRFAGLQPEVVLGLGPEALAMLAARALAPKPVRAVGVEHVHAPKVSVREQAELLVGRLRSAGRLSFRALVADAGDTIVVVGRFLALLELFRDGSVAFEQADALADLHVRWTGGERSPLLTGSDFDEDMQAVDIDSEDGKERA